MTTEEDTEIIVVREGCRCRLKTIAGNVLPMVCVILLAWPFLLLTELIWKSNFYCIPGDDADVYKTCGAKMDNGALFIVFFFILFLLPLWSGVLVYRLGGCREGPGTTHKEPARCAILVSALALVPFILSMSTAYQCASLYHVTKPPLTLDAAVTQSFDTRLDATFAPSLINTSVFGRAVDRDNKYIYVFPIDNSSLVYRARPGSNQVAISGDGMVWVSGPWVDEVTERAVHDLLDKNDTKHVTVVVASNRYGDAKYYNTQCTRLNTAFFALLWSVLGLFVVTDLYWSRNLYFR